MPGAACTGHGDVQTADHGGFQKTGARGAGRDEDSDWPLGDGVNDVRRRWSPPRSTLSAEIQRRLLPAAFTCEAGALTLSGWLEPAATVGGDTFDYSLDRHALHLSISDAMGFVCDRGGSRSSSGPSKPSGQRPRPSLRHRLAVADEARARRPGAPPAA